MRLFLAPPVLLLALPLSAQEDSGSFQSGWYVGASGGFSNADASGSDVSADLAGLGYPDITTDLDDTDVGWKAYGGYRFEAPFAIEFGYADLGTIESDISGMVSDLTAFLNDVSAIHPFNGEGVTAAACWFPVRTENFQGMIKGGAWAWEADVDVQAAGASVDVDEDGVDGFFGIGLLWDLGNDLSLRAEYEQYYLDSEDVRFLSAGLQYRFR